MVDELLAMDGLQVRAAKREILHGVDLAVAAGEVQVILGPNGSGKSTLLKAVMGAPGYVVTGGSLRYKGRDIHTLSTTARARDGIFLSFQEPEEIPGITLEDMLRTARQAITGKTCKLAAFHREMLDCMEKLQMDESYARRYVNAGFSGGEKKRAEILQLLLLQPKLALLDETDSGLDVDAVQLVSAGVQAYHNKDNACLIITHNTRILQHLQVDRVHILLDGRICCSGGVELAAKVEAEGFGWLQDTER